MITNKQIYVAINYLFPELHPNSHLYRKIEKLIRQEFQRIGTCVLWYRNKAFMNLLDSTNLSIDNKEVIVTRKAIKATENYHNVPCLIFEA